MHADNMEQLRKDYLRGKCVEAWFAETMSRDPECSMVLAVSKDIHHSDMYDYRTKETFEIKEDSKATTSGNVMFELRASEMEPGWGLRYDGKTTYLVFVDTDRSRILCIHAKPFIKYVKDIIGEEVINSDWKGVKKTMPDRWRLSGVKHNMQGKVILIPKTEISRAGFIRADFSVTKFGMPFKEFETRFFHKLNEVETLDAKKARAHEFVDLFCRKTYKNWLDKQEKLKPAKPQETHLVQVQGEILPQPLPDTAVVAASTPAPEREEPKKKEARDKFIHLHNHSSFCLSGNSIIYGATRHHERGVCYRNDYTRIKRCRTIKELYERWGSGKFTRYSVKVFDGDKFVPSTIKNITYSGIKEVYEITTDSGKKIKATSMHKFLGFEKWQRLEEFSVGDLIACNGEKCYESREWMEKKYIQEGLNRQQIADICGVNIWLIIKSIHEFNMHKTKSEFMKGHYVSEKCKENLREAWVLRNQRTPSAPKTDDGYRFQARKKRKDKSEISGESRKLCVHHIDGNPRNNSPDNLMTITQKEHRIIHATQPYTKKYEKIISIVRIGMEDTYDLEVKHESHNFVANGFITHNSLLDGVANPDEIAKRVYEMGQPGAAITDHGYMFGNYKFFKACRQYGIKDMQGFEAYYVPDAVQKSDRFQYHLILLAMNDTGWKNLININSTAGRDGFYYKPRIDAEMLNRFNEGLIVLSGCYKSPVAFHLSEEGRDPDLAKKNMLMLKGIFGDRFYNEVMHINWAESDRVMPELIQIATENGIKSVVTNDCHYMNKEDAETQSVMLKMNVKNKDFTFDSTDLYLKTRQEMVCEYVTEQMADTTLEIMDRVTLDLGKIFTGESIFPNYDITTSKDYKQFEEYYNKKGVK